MSFPTPFANKVNDLIDSDPSAEGDVAAVGVRDAVLQSLMHLSAVAQRLLEANATRTDTDLVKGDVFFTTINILTQVHLLILFLAHVPPKTRQWWKMEAAILSQLELSLMTICKFAPPEVPEESEKENVEHAEEEKATEN